MTPPAVAARRENLESGPTASFTVRIGEIACSGTMHLVSQGENTAGWSFVGSGTTGSMCFDAGPFGTIGLIQLDNGDTLWTSGP